MARSPQPWHRASRNAWFVTINGTQHNLGPDKKQALEDVFWAILNSREFMFNH